MKKFIFILIITVLGLSFKVDCQERDIFYRALSSVNLAGKDSVSIMLPQWPTGKDVSVQLAGARYGSGDSIRAQVIYYQSNSLNTNDWVALKTDTILSVTTTRTSILYEDLNYLGLRLRIWINAYTLADTVTYTPYVIYKK